MAPHSWIFSAFSVDSSSCFCLFTPGTVPIPVHTVLKYGTEFIQYVMLHFWDQSGAASRRYRNRTEITVFMCKQKPYPVWLSFRRKSYNPGQNVLGHLRKLGTKTHFAKLTHILPLKKAWGCCYKGLFLLSPSPPSSVDCVELKLEYITSTLHRGGRVEGRYLNLTSYCVSVPRVLTGVVAIRCSVNIAWGKSHVHQSIVWEFFASSAGKKTLLS